MSDKPRTAFDVLKIALVLGVLGDILLRQTPWGLNVLLFNLAFVGAMVIVHRRSGSSVLSVETIPLLAAQVFFAAMFVVRDSIELRIADSIAIVVILGVLIVPRLQVDPRIAGVIHYALGTIWAALNSLFAPIMLLAADVDWKGTNRSAFGKGMVSVVKSILIVTPVLIIFGALFVAADAAYQALLEGIFSVPSDAVITHSLLFAFFAWASAGYFRGMFLGKVPNTADGEMDDSKPSTTVADLRDDPVDSPAFIREGESVFEHINRSDPPQSDEPPPKQTKKWAWKDIDNTLLPNGLLLGKIEVGLIFGLVNILFLSFVIVQLPYLFGGMELVQNTPDFKLAEYARRGFGELVAVSALDLPLLLIGHWLIRRDNASAGKLFKFLAGVQIALLFVIMASAAQRLFLLTGELGYGMTTIRLYPMIFMTWLAIVFVWFGITVLRGARHNFAWGALWSALLVLGATHVLNPDDFIVRKNLALAQQGRAFDARYNSQLSSDALPPLIQALPSMSFEDQCVVRSAVANRYKELAEGSELRSFNLSRREALSILSADPSVTIAPEGCPSYLTNWHVEGGD